MNDYDLDYTNEELKNLLMKAIYNPKNLPEWDYNGESLLGGKSKSAKESKLEEVYNDMFVESGKVLNEEHKKAFDTWANDYADTLTKNTITRLEKENAKLKAEIEECEAEIDEMGDYIIKLEQDLEKR